MVLKEGSLDKLKITKVINIYTKFDLNLEDIVFELSLNLEKYCFWFLLDLNFVFQVDNIRLKAENSRVKAANTQLKAEVARIRSDAEENVLLRAENADLRAEIKRRVESETR